MVSAHAGVRLLAVPPAASPRILLATVCDRGQHRSSPATLSLGRRVSPKSCDSAGFLAVCIYHCKQWTDLVLKVISSIDGWENHWIVKQCVARKRKCCCATQSSSPRRILDIPCRRLCATTRSCAPRALECAEVAGNRVQIHGVVKRNVSSPSTTGNSAGLPRIIRFCVHISIRDNQVATPHDLVGFVLAHISLDALGSGTTLRQQSSQDSPLVGHPLRPS